MASSSVFIAPHPRLPEPKPAILPLLNIRPFVSAIATSKPSRLLTAQRSSLLTPLEPNDSEGWYYLGRTKYNENRFAEAIGAFQQCPKLDPNNVKAEDNLGLSFAGLGRNEETTAAYQQAIDWQAQSLTKNPGPYIDLGSLLIDENRPQEAVSFLLQAIEIAPRESRAHVLGKAYTGAEEFPKAQAELEKAIELSPQTPNLHCMLAPVYRKRGLIEKAKA